VVAEKDNGFVFVYTGCSILSISIFETFANILICRFRFNRFRLICYLSIFHSDCFVTLEYSIQYVFISSISMLILIILNVFVLFYNLNIMIKLHICIFVLLHLRTVDFCSLICSLYLYYFKTNYVMVVVKKKKVRLIILISIIIGDSVAIFLYDF